LDGGAPWTVVLVNGCRAHCERVTRVVVEVQGRLFTARRRQTLDISPTSDVEVQPRRGGDRAGRRS
jgi:hypothetical protein